MACLHRNGALILSTSAQMFLGGQDVAVLLLKEGLAKMDEYSNSKELAEAEEEAKRAQKNVSRH